MRFFKVTIEKHVFIECDTFYNAREFAGKCLKGATKVEPTELEEIVSHFPEAKLYKVESVRSESQKNKAHLERDQLNAKTKRRVITGKEYKRNANEAPKDGA